MMNGHYTVAPGDAIYEDINHDGVINQYDIVYLGNSQPRFTGGCGFNITYKQFKLVANFYGRYGQKVINMTRLNNESMYGINNQSTAVLRRWRNEGDMTEIPRALWGRLQHFRFRPFCGRCFLSSFANFIIELPSA